jgi:hypothetical protein
VGKRKVSLFVVGIDLAAFSIIQRSSFGTRPARLSGALHFEFSQSCGNFNVMNPKRLFI